MPTRSPKTEQCYLRRAAQIAKAENKAAGRPLSPLELAEAVRARDVSSSTYRQMRASVVFAMEQSVALQGPERAAELKEAIALLKKPRPKSQDEDGDGGGTFNTSRQKQKVGIEKDIKRICHTALATRSPNARDLVNLLRSGMLAGARLVEWPSAKFGPSEVVGFAWELKFRNGKCSNGRSHGERSHASLEGPAGRVWSPR